MQPRTFIPFAAAALLALGAGSAEANRVAHTSATCSDYSNQADAQRAADTRDADGDGIYCESLPCPCLKPGSGGGSPSPSCTKPTGVTSLSFSKTKYPNIRRHFLGALRRTLDLGTRPPLVPNERPLRLGTSYAKGSFRVRGAGST